MKKFENLGKLLSKNEQIQIKGGCTPEQMCDPNDIESCGGFVTCDCLQQPNSFQCCRNAMAACVINHGCFAVGWACA